MDFEEAEIDGVFDCYPVIKVPGRFSGACFLRKEVEERIIAIVG